ncbi:hypothetical protein NE237_014056 [Protea cynaroides]|uniref:CCHC-type domain-containing protein n=1 Tax=Protea cynaroides TaxID=273540 RepID=A0A9Q0K0R0_9MAGN|nr:hypothetical protein NE237_014056 [Protea cynaroides]
MEIGKPHPEEVIIQHQYRGHHFLFRLVEYEERPIRCMECKSFGHRLENCPALREGKCVNHGEIPVDKDGERNQVHNGAQVSKPVGRWADADKEEDRDVNEGVDMEDCEI